MVVHHIEMDDVRARIEHSLDFISKPRKVGGKNRRRYKIIVHPESVPNLGREFSTAQGSAGGVTAGR